MEEFEKIFAKYVTENVVTEEAKNELSTMFEATVNKKVAAVLEEKEKSLEEELDKKYQTTFESERNEIVDKIDKYMSEAVDEVITQNKFKIQNALVVEKAKNIIVGVQKVFEQEGISLPDNDSDIVKEMNEKVATLSEKVDKLLMENKELKDELFEAEKAIIFMKNTEDLSILSREKCLNMMDGMAVESIEDFNKKLDIIKSNLITERKSKKVKEEDDPDDMDDEKDDIDEKDDEDENLKNESCSSKKKRTVKEEYLKQFEKMTK